MGLLDSFNPLNPGGMGDALKDPFGFDAAKSANQANQRRYGNALNLWDQLIAQQPQAYGAAQGYYKQALGSINKGYNMGRANLATAGQSAKTDINTRGTQQLANSQQSLASRGLYNTTAFDAASRGIHADTSRALASVDESIAGLLANLQVSQGQAQAGAYGAMGQLQQNQFGSLAGLYGGKIGTITQRQDVAGPSLFSQLAPLIGGVMGMKG